MTSQETASWRESLVELNATQNLDVALFICAFLVLVCAGVFAIFKGSTFHYARKRHFGEIMDGLLFAAGSISIAGVVFLFL